MQLRRLRELREKHGYTQAVVGNYINFSQRAYAYFEDGKRTLTPETLCALARLYKVSADYILELSDNPTPNFSV